MQKGAGDREVLQTGYPFCISTPIWLSSFPETPPQHTHTPFPVNKTEYRWRLRNEALLCAKNPLPAHPGSSLASLDPTSRDPVPPHPPGTALASWCIRNCHCGSSKLRSQPRARQWRLAQALRGPRRTAVRRRVSPERHPAARRQGHPPQRFPASFSRSEERRFPSGKQSLPPPPTSPYPGDEGAAISFASPRTSRAA